MSETFQSRLEILPKAQKLIWPELAPLASSGFVLYRGTAIALQLGHRSSIDFDFFSDRKLDRGALAASMPMLKTAKVLQEQPDSWTVLAGSEVVKISFFGGIDHGRVGTPKIAQGNGLPIASLEDLLATKLKVILQRIEAKDYIDIAALISGSLSPSFGLAAGLTLYGPALSLSEIVEQTLIHVGAGPLPAVQPKSKRLSL